MFERIIEVLTIVIPLIPIIFQLFALLTAKTHNQRIKNLSERAQIIVGALEKETNLTNVDKKMKALSKLAKYASEVGIKVTADQLNDYIESSIDIVRAINK